MIIKFRVDYSGEIAHYELSYIIRKNLKVFYEKTFLSVPTYLHFSAHPKYRNNSCLFAELEEWRLRLALKNEQTRSPTNSDVKVHSKVRSIYIELLNREGQK